MPDGHAAARKAVAEHVNTDQQRQDLQGSQCADADGRVLQNIEHDRKRQCLKARCKAEIPRQLRQGSAPAATGTTECPNGGVPRA